MNLNEAIWVYSDSMAQWHMRVMPEITAVKERGAKAVPFSQLTDAILHSDRHLIFTFMSPSEMKKLTVLKRRGNYSIVLDDWWIMPQWVLYHATFKIFRKFHGIAAHVGCGFAEKTPSILMKTRPASRYSLFAAAMRPVSLAISPFVNFWKGVQSEGWKQDGLLFFPYSIDEKSVPLKKEPTAYKFSLTASVCGIWIMRAALAPYQHNLGNLYYDREKLVDLIHRTKYSVFDWRNLNPPRQVHNWDAHCSIVRQSLFTIATGGFHRASVPKFIESVCLGTPMIGSDIPYEYPSVSDCLYDMDIPTLNDGNIKQRLLNALEMYPVLKENCLKWRDKLLHLHSNHSLLNMLQAQIHGQPIPAGYLK